MFDISRLIFICSNMFLRMCLHAPKNFILDSTLMAEVKIAILCYFSILLLNLIIDVLIFDVFREEPADGPLAIYYF